MVSLSRPTPLSVTAGQKLYAFQLQLDATGAVEGGGFLDGCNLPVSVRLDSVLFSQTIGSPVMIKDCGLIGNVVLLNGASGGSTCSGTSSTIVASAGTGGGISPSGSILVPTGTNSTFAIGSAACYHIADVLVDGASVGAVSSYTFTNVVANHTIAASFALNSYTISASASSGGSISPAGAVAVSCAGNQAFTLSPSGGNILYDVLVDGASVGAVSSYTFTNVTGDHTIAAQFGPPPVLTVYIAGSGSVARNPNQASYTPGTTVQLTATASPGYHFDSWSGDATGHANPVTLTMTADKSVTAVFLANTYFWNTLGSANWQVSTNWTPTRWSPSTDDVLSFTNGATIATNVPTQTIGQLFITGSADVTLQPDVAGDSVAVLGGSGVDFNVQPGATLRFNTANAIKLDLLAGATGTVTGTLVVDAGAHRLRSLTAGGLKG